MVTEFKDCLISETQMKRIATASRGFRTDFFLSIVYKKISQSRSRKVFLILCHFDERRNLHEKLDKDLILVAELLAKISPFVEMTNSTIISIFIKNLSTLRD